VDILSGGFPCQPFSTAGRKQADSDPRHLWPYIKQGIRELNRPALIFLENVEGIISAKLKGDEWADPAGTSVLHHVLRELERLGYKAEAGLFSACEVGAPHQRKRVYILGVRNDLAKKGISLINELIKRNDSSFELGYTKSKQDGFRELRDLEKEKPKMGEKFWDASWSTSKSTAWPAPRGQKQYWYEPPRLTRELHRQIKHNAIIAQGV
jgi:site-specific DNA-cytosine methylase